MKGQNTWSYSPYRPPLYEVGDIYVCRIAPSANAIRFEWLPVDSSLYSVFYRARGEEAFIHWGYTRSTHCDITGLDTKTDYEFYVTSGEKKSRVRLARTGESVGTVVNYLHPEDTVYSFSGRYLCSPSIVRHPDGYLLASMDLYAHAHPQNLTLIFRSDDDGDSWHYVSELMPCFWGKLFVHRGELYMLACSTEYGDLLIGKSDDGGKSFCAPVCLLRGANGKNGSSGVHRYPQNNFYHGGRLYTTLEWGAWANKEYCHAAMVMSCDENSDLLDPASWSFSEPRAFDHFTEELTDLPKNSMTIEGTLTLAPNGKLLNIMRFARYGYALAYEVNTDDPEAKLVYSRLIEFPANLSKFTITRDEVSGYYYSVATRLYDSNRNARDLLSLLRSPDLEHWEVVCDLHDYRGIDSKLIGFQYVDFMIEGNDLLYLCRTALNGANSYHDSNYSTFHRVKDFRNITADR